MSVLLFKRFRRSLEVAVCVFLLVAFPIDSIIVGAPSDKVLQRVKGVIGYEPSANARFTPVFGRFQLPDDFIAVTERNAAALVALPDSSLVALGENTHVQVGAFNNAVEGPGASITVNNGTLRFDIHRPAGGAANYRFTTPTTQIAVRGTIGLLAFAGGTTTVVCLVCAADSISATVGTQTFSVLTGQILSVSATGAVVSGTLSSATLNTFSNAGVSTSTSSGSAAATAGVSSGAASGAASGASSVAGSSAASAAGAAGATSAVVPAVATAGVVAGAVAASTKTAIPLPTPTANLSVNGIHRGLPAGPR